mmetsp:Transcript_82387/g.214666  ORF Transcript_82387/g.214666 Transcript_82387/m.214666 type:complete len:533 (+) Transcript_82387:25-1623(+)
MKPIVAAAVFVAAALLFVGDGVVLRGVMSKQNGTMVEHGSNKFGSPGCPCIGFDNIEGDHVVTIFGEEVRYPADLGSSCEAWDEGVSPECTGDKAPEYCKEPWCYVDPRNCDIAVTFKVSIYQPKAMFQNLPLHYSYSTCDAKDTFTSEAPDVGMSSCRCIGFDNSTGTTIATVGDAEIEFPAELGGHCKAWDEGAHPDCKGDDPPAWCAKKWCFVDPCSCSGLEAPPKASDYLGNGTVQGKQVHYSYATCGEQDSYSSEDKKKDAEMGFNCTAHEIPDKFGKEQCSCVGFDGIKGDTSVKINKTEVKYPADLGGSCDAWDDGVNPSCVGNETAAWCKEKWCYVDPRKCEIDVPPKMPPPNTSYQPGARYQNLPLYYSYSTCGSKDMWAENIPNVGLQDCLCIGFDNSPGTTFAMLGAGEKVAYPAEVGGECKAWDEGLHPECKGDRPAEWCSKKWCFVDVAACNAQVPPTLSEYLGDATFQGKKIYFSYATCGDENLYVSSKELYNHTGYEDDWNTEYRNGHYPKWATPAP